MLPATACTGWVLVLDAPSDSGCHRALNGWHHVLTELLLLCPVQLSSDKDIKPKA